MSGTYYPLSRHRHCLGAFYTHNSPFSGLQNLLVKGAIVSFPFPHLFAFLLPTQTVPFEDITDLDKRKNGQTGPPFVIKQRLLGAWRVDWRGIFRWPGQEGSGKKAPEKFPQAFSLWCGLFALQASGIFADVSSLSKFKIIIVKRKTAPFCQAVLFCQLLCSLLS